MRQENTESYKILRFHQVEVTDLHINTTTLFTTKTELIKFFGVHTKAIFQREKKRNKSSI